MKQLLQPYASFSISLSDINQYLHTYIGNENEVAASTTHELIKEAMCSNKLF